MKKQDNIIRKSIEMASLEFKDAPMEVYYKHPVVGILSRLRVKHILKLLSDFQGKRVLDIGCEAGYVSQKISKNGTDVISFDICFEALITYKHKIENNYTRYLPFQAFAHEIPLKDKSVDAVVCTEVIEHAPYVEAIFKEISRVVGKGGKIVITFPNERLRKKIYGVVRLFGINTEIEKDVTLFQYTLEEIELLCGKYFKVISRYSIPFCFPLTRFIVCLKE
jgi:2-polyprenyl-6-hydroxyphenyl methylase/3-demethylubiquinone-9 3-methyltransferase